MHGFTKALARELATKGVTVNTISPGYIGTKMVTAIPKEILDTKILPEIPVAKARQAGRSRGAGDLPLLQRSRLHHWSQHLHQRRPAHAVGARRRRGRFTGRATGHHFERDASQASMCGQVCFSPGCRP